MWVFHPRGQPSRAPPDQRRVPPIKPLLYSSHRADNFDAFFYAHYNFRSGYGAPPTHVPFEIDRELGRIPVWRTAQTALIIKECKKAHHVELLP